MTSNPTKPKVRTPLVASFKQGSRTYELTLSDCGSRACKRCSGFGGRRASHGPYWYMCSTRNSKWVRVYMGRELDTTLHVLPDGSVDWLSVDQAKGKRKSLARSIPLVSSAPRLTSLERVAEKERILDSGGSVQDLVDKGLMAHSTPP